MRRNKTELHPDVRDVQQKIAGYESLLKRAPHDCELLREQSAELRSQQLADRRFADSDLPSRGPLPQNKFDKQLKLLDEQVAEAERELPIQKALLPKVQKRIDDHTERLKEIAPLAKQQRAIATEILQHLDKAVVATKKATELWEKVKEIAVDVNPTFVVTHDGCLPAWPQHERNSLELYTNKLRTEFDLAQQKLDQACEDSEQRAVGLPTAKEIADAKADQAHAYTVKHRATMRRFNETEQGKKAYAILIAKIHEYYKACKEGAADRDEYKAEAANVELGYHVLVDEYANLQFDQNALLLHEVLTI